MTFTEPAAEAAGDAACGISRRFRGGLDVGHGAAAACASRRAAHGPKENVESVKFFSWPADEPDVG